MGADKAYDSEDFVRTVRELNVTPHITKNAMNRSSNLDRRTTRQPGYAISLALPLADRKGLVVEANWSASASHCADWRRWTGCSCSVAPRITRSGFPNSSLNHQPCSGNSAPELLVSGIDRINDTRKTR